jgi:hypothetical protein
LTCGRSLSIAPALPLGTVCFSLIMLRMHLDLLAEVINVLGLRSTGAAVVARRISATLPLPARVALFFPV